MGYIPILLALATTTILTGPNIILLAEDQLQALPVTQEEIQRAVAFYSDVYDVSTSTLNKVIQNESQFNQYAKNINPPVETSYGLVQINTLAHKEITKNQAYNPWFAINYLAKSISEGNGFWWSGYNKIKKGGKDT